MCLFKQPKMQSMAVPPAIQPRVPTDTNLPAKRDVVSPDTKADVSFGGGTKKTSPSAGKKTGTDALKIKLNTGGETGSGTGGLNV